jgi:two-component system, chemotaxis family, response regulator Rcp1
MDREKDPISASPYLEPQARELERRPIQVLLAEDNPGDVYLVREALSLERLQFNLLVRSDGEQMSDFIDRIDSGAEPCPDVVLLDLNLPRRSGVSLLERLRQSSLCGAVPVIVVTSSASPQDREMATRLGASSYFQKPSDFDEFMRLGSLVRQFVSTSAAPVR